MKTFSKVIIEIVKAIWLVIVLFLWAISCYSTSYVTQYAPSGEKIYYIADKPWIHMVILGIIALLGGVIGATRKRGVKKNKKSIVFLIGFSFCVCAMLIVWGWITSMMPNADQREVWNAAVYVHSNYLATFQEDGYMFIYPNQYGLFLLEYVLMGMVDAYKTLGILMLLNSISVVLICLCFYWIVQMFGETKQLATIVYYLPYAFIPGLLYVTFIYGTLIGLALSLLGFAFLIKYINGSPTWNAVLSMMFLVLASIIKNNYLISLLAAFCILMLDILKNRRMKSLIVFSVGVLFFVFANKTVTITVEHITGYEKNSGIPSLAWVAMGLHDSKYSAEGWYDTSSIKTYIETGYDAQKTSEIAKNDIKNSLTNFIDNPLYSIRFFSRKIASQWNDPTFECFWIYRTRESHSSYTDRLWMKYVIEFYNGNKTCIALLNILQSLVLSGCILYIILNWQKIQIVQLVLPSCFIGGFLFHLIWEAKSQYTFPYFVLLIPYAIIGLKCMMTEIKELFEKKKIKISVVGIFVAMVLSLVAVGANSGIRDSVFQITDGCEIYSTSEWR